MPLPRALFRLYGGEQQMPDHRAPRGDQPPPRPSREAPRHFWSPYCDLENARAAPDYVHVNYVLRENPDSEPPFVEFIQAILTRSYRTLESVREFLEELGEKEAADYIREAMPTAHHIRFGDLGEIALAEFIESSLYTSSDKETSK
jgi:hypothetical protein